MPIVIWDPPLRIRLGAADGAPGRVHDIRVAQGTGGRSVIRLIDDGVDDADAQATSRGWDIMLQMLQERAVQH
jgi:hypothetical protein